MRLKRKRVSGGELGAVELLGDFHYIEKARKFV